MGGPVQLHHLGLSTSRRGGHFTRLPASSSAACSFSTHAQFKMMVKAWLTYDYLKAVGAGTTLHIPTSYRAGTRLLSYFAGGPGPSAPWQRHGGCRTCASVPARYALQVGTPAAVGNACLAKQGWRPALGLTFSVMIQENNSQCRHPCEHFHDPSPSFAARCGSPDVCCLRVAAIASSGQRAVHVQQTMREAMLWYGRLLLCQCEGGCATGVRARYGGTQIMLSRAAGGGGARLCASGREGFARTGQFNRGHRTAVGICWLPLCLLCTTLIADRSTSEATTLKTRGGWGGCASPAVLPRARGVVEHPIVASFRISRAFATHLAVRVARLIAPVAG